MIAAGGWVLFCAALSVLSLVRLFALALAPCAPSLCSLAQLDAHSAETVNRAGFSLAQYASLVVSIGAIIAFAFLSLAILVLVRGRTTASCIAAAVLSTLATSATASGPRTGLSSVLWAVGTAGLFWLLAAYPTLTFSPSWLVLPVGAAAAWSVTLVVLPAGTVETQPWASFEGVVFTLALLGVVIGQIVRFRSGDGKVRRQLRLILAVLMLIVLSGAAWSISIALVPAWGPGSLPNAISLEWSSTLMLLAAGCLAWAIAREQALGVAVSGTLVGAILITVFFTCYGLLVAVASTAISGSMPEAFAAFASAIVLAALFRPMSRQVERLVYGDDDSADALVAMLSATLAEASADQPVLPELLRATAQHLRLPFLRLRQDDATVEVGIDAGPRTVETFDLDTRGVGTSIDVGLRDGERRLPSRTRRALRSAGAPFLAAATTDRLTRSLRASRLQLAATRDEERRTLRRELHDEVVPSLASARYRIGAARGADDASRLDHLTSAETSLDIAITDLRKLSRSLRPLELDTLGLRQAIERFSDEMAVNATVGGQGLGPIPAFVEVAVYRIAIEALLNVERHAQASTVNVDLTRTASAVELTISDDGIGLSDDAVWGVGLVSIHERVAELGGRLRLRRNEPHGLRMDCLLPLEVSG